MPGYGRALRRACPRCGHAPVFRSFYDLTDRCAGCDLRFEREPGYWIGAMIINTALISFLFLASMGLGMWLFWPDVPWGWLLAGAGQRHLCGQLGSRRGRYVQQHRR